MFAERIGKVKKTKIELELIKHVDCFLDGHGNCDSNLVSLKKIFVNQPIFEFQRDMYKSIGSENDIVITPVKNPITVKKAITKKSTKRETDINHTLVKNILTPSHCGDFPTNCSLMFGALRYIIQRESGKAI